MDDDKQYTITLDPEDTYPGSAAYTSTAGTTASVDDDFCFDSNAGTFTINTSSISEDWNYDSNITVPEDADIKIGDRSLKTFMDTMEKRMAILQPDPKKLEKFEALQKAYEHYKHLERLCEIDDEDEQEGPNF